MSSLEMPHLQVVSVSTREGRRGPGVTDWFLKRARAHGKFDIELVDLKKVGLPLFDEPHHPRLQRYEHEHTKAWSATVKRADAFVFVTPEYDYSTPSALVNAVQYLVHEWAHKPVGFVSYGGVSGGTRGVQMTKQLVTAVRMMPLSEAVAIPFFEQYFEKESGVFDPGEVQEKAATVMLDSLLRWTEALRQLRSP
jgi:NAD(P)H-dependent FMN reductase